MGGAILHDQAITEPYNNRKLRTIYNKAVFIKSRSYGARYDRVKLLMCRNSTTIAGLAMEVWVVSIQILLKEASVPSRYS